MKPVKQIKRATLVFGKDKNHKIKSTHIV